MAKKKKKQAEVLTHGQKLKKNIDDVKFVMILLGVLILITGGWNYYNHGEVEKEKKLSRAYDQVREEVMTMADPDTNPGFLELANDVKDKNYTEIDFIQTVKKAMQEAGIRFKQGKNAVESNDAKWPFSTSETTNEEYINTPPIAEMTMQQLVEVLDYIKKTTHEIWCTEISNLEPYFDKEGYAVTTGPLSGLNFRNPVYKVSSLRFSRSIDKGNN